jgi:pimeloyl-[acyl-carrier protein] methyl ester esterase
MKTLVLLHGWGATGNIWRRQVEAFSSRGITLLTPTFPTWEVSWLVDFLQELSLPDTILVGWSLGGMLLLEALSQELVAPGALVLVATPASFCERPDLPYGQPRAVVRALRRTVREDRRRGLLDFASRCLVPGEENFQEEISQDFQPQENGADLAAGLDYLINTDLRSQLSRIPAGALIIQGDQDNIVPPAQTEALRHYLKDARMVRIPGAGHAPFLTRAGEFNEVLKGYLRERARVRGPLPPPSNSLPQSHNSGAQASSLCSTGKMPVLPGRGVEKEI